MKQKPTEEYLIDTWISLVAKGSKCKVKEVNSLADQVSRHWGYSKFSHGVDVIGLLLFRIIESIMVNSSREEVVHLFNACKR